MAHALSGYREGTIQVTLSYVYPDGAVGHTGQIRPDACLMLGHFNIIAPSNTGTSITGTDWHLSLGNIPTGGRRGWGKSATQ